VDVDDLLQVGTFTDEGCQTVYKVMKDFFDENEGANSVDLPTLTAFANKHKYQLSQYKALIGNCKSGTEKNLVRKVAGKLKKLEIAATLYHTVESSQTALRKIDGSESFSQITGIIENPLNEVIAGFNSTNEGGPVHLGSIAGPLIDKWFSNPVKQVGLSTGFPIFDKSIGGGMRRGTVNLIASRVKQGKSSWSVNVGLNVSKTSVKVLYLDTEMSDEDQLARCLGNLTGVHSTLIQTGQVNKEQSQLVFKARDELQKIPFTRASIVGMPFEDIVAIIRRWLLKDVGKDSSGVTKDCLVIYDYFKLMDAGILKDMQEYQAIGFQMNTLHNLFTKYNAPCLSFVQLNRDGISKEDTSVLSQSDRLGWLSDNVSIWKQKSDDELTMDPETTHKMVPVVQRHGNQLEDGEYITYKFNKQACQIQEVGTRSDSFAKAVKKNKKKQENEQKPAGEAYAF
jgi:replicative DNA helicase